MEAHPIPQNITTFQFRLVGDMTLKQFLYLATGSGIAYFLFVFAAPLYPLISWPLIVVSTLLGLAFAFLPVNSRPLDQWLAAFLKAVYSPTKRVWRKEGKSYKDNPVFGNRLSIYLSSLDQTQPTFTPSPSITSSFQPVSQQMPTSEELKQTVELAKQAQNLKQKIVQAERTLSELRTAASQPQPIPVDYSEEVNKVLSDLKNLVGQTSQVRQKLESINAPQKPQPNIPPPPPPKIVKVKLPPRPKQQVALTTFPNVINGIVQDVSGSYLSGVVAVIYDKEGLPVRALKTNKLGQFSGSTPLPNGVYTLELEKEGFGFDVLQMELTGQILPPLIITAKEAFRS